MIRAALSFFVSGLVLLLGVCTAWQQARNYARAAELDRMQTEVEWFERVASEMHADLVRLEFEYASEIEQTRARSQSVEQRRGVRGSE